MYDSFLLSNQHKITQVHLSKDRLEGLKAFHEIRKRVYKSKGTNVLFAEIRSVVPTFK